ncbi:MAG: hypothetical protein F6K39_33570 [Okeania sp. SIO3B3]|nr:hypothetical protein [Okeania sp. SIO3B3]
MNTYTLEEGRQRELFAQHSAGKAAGAEEKKRLKGIKFFITDPSEHDIKIFKALCVKTLRFNQQALISSP